MSDESRRAFERALPSHWVFRPQYPDYGIDGEVEVFDKTGASTGLRFYVQLKATDGTDEQARSVRITKEVARYYYALDLPVLIVSFHSPSETLYARWFQEINPPDAAEDNGTVSVKFEASNRWANTTANSLLRDLHARRALRSGAVATPIPFLIDRDPPDTQSELVRELTAALRPLRGIIEPTTDVNRALVTFVIRPRKIIVQLGKEFSRSLGLPEDVKDQRALAADTLLLLAWALGRARQYPVAGKIALAVVDSSKLIERPEVFGPLAGYLATGHRLVDALEMADRLTAKYGSTWAAAAFHSLALTTRGMSAAEMVIYEKYLDHRLELATASGDPQQIAMALYNRGNHRAATNLRAAVRDYLAAVRSDPTYWDRDYFSSELGGLFFRLRRFKCAVACYERSVDRGAEIEIEARLADALIFAGQYEKATTRFDSYLDQTKDQLSPQWRLKHWALSQILKLGIKNQTRETGAALALADNPATLDEALQLDALCGLAWLNKGAGSLAKDRRMAFVYYLLAAISQDWDLAAWRNAFALSAEDAEDQKVGPYIMMAAYEIHGERFLEALASAAQGSAEKKSEYIAELRLKLDEWLPKTGRTREVRLLGPNSEYISFDLGSGAITHRKGPGSA